MSGAPGSERIRIDFQNAIGVAKRLGESAEDMSRSIRDLTNARSAVRNAWKDPAGDAFSDSLDTLMRDLNGRVDDLAHIDDQIVRSVKQWADTQMRALQDAMNLPD